MFGGTVNMKLSFVALILCLAIVIPAFAGDKKKDQKKTDAAATIVDSGSFGVFVSGRRVATETFTIKQLIDSNSTTSDIKLEGSKETQHSELHLTPHGDLIRYDWKESGGQEKGETSVEPAQQFLMQKVKANDKYTEQPYLMPNSSAVLDDYFFSHRELLLWRYLGSGCVLKQGQQGCDLQKAEFGFVVPRQRSSGMVTLGYVGKETVQIHGVTKPLDKFSMSSDFGEWFLYLDENKKLVRVIILGENTEVIRD
jgi:hypothetical protein